MENRKERDMLRKWPCEDIGRNWSEVVLNLELARIARQHRTMDGVFGRAIRGAQPVTS